MINFLSYLVVVFSNLIILQWYATNRFRNEHTRISHTNTNVSEYTKTAANGSAKPFFLSLQVDQKRDCAIFCIFVIFGIASNSCCPYMRRCSVCDSVPLLTHENIHPKSSCPLESIPPCTRTIYLYIYVCLWSPPVGDSLHLRFAPQLSF